MSTFFTPPELGRIVTSRLYTLGEYVILPAGEFIYCQFNFPTDADLNDGAFVQIPLVTSGSQTRFVVTGNATGQTNGLYGFVRGGQNYPAGTFTSSRPGFGWVQISGFVNARASAGSAGNPVYTPGSAGTAGAVQGSSGTGSRQLLGAFFIENVTANRAQIFVPKASIGV